MLFIEQIVEFVKQRHLPAFTEPLGKIKQDVGVRRPSWIGRRGCVDGRFVAFPRFDALGQRHRAFQFRRCAVELAGGVQRPLEEVRGPCPGSFDLPRQLDEDLSLLQHRLIVLLLLEEWQVDIALVVGDVRIRGSASSVSRFAEC